MRVIDAKISDVASTYSPHRVVLLMDVNPYQVTRNIVCDTRELGGGTMYWFGKQGGLVYFGLHDPKNEHGYGGATIEVRTRDGVRSFRGPWSSNAQVMERLFGIPSFDVTATNSADEFEHGRAFWLVHITLSAMLDAMTIMRRRGEPWSLGKSQYSYEVGRMNCPTAKAPGWCGSEVAHDVPDF